MSRKLSDKTIQSYTRRLDFLTRAGGPAVDPLDPVRTIATVLALNVADGTRVGYFNALKYSTRNNDTVSKQYTAKITEINKSIKAFSAKQTMTDSEVRKYGDKYPEWETILAAAAKIKADATVDDQFRLLIEFYTLVPPKRLDYINFTLYDTDPAVDVGNYAVVRDVDPYIKINDHKMSARGALRDPIPPTLLTSIREFMTKYPTVRVLWDLPDYAISRRIITLFRRATGKPYSVNTLRHAWATLCSRGERSIAKKRADAKSLGHSTGMSDQYRRI